MENETNNRIVPAGFGRRTMAFILDFLIVFLASMILWNTVGSSSLMEAFGTVEKLTELYEYAEDSGLFEITYDDDGQYSSMAVHSYVAGKEDSDGNIQGEGDGQYGYELYLAESFYGFTEFLASDSRVDAEVTVDDVTYAKEDYYTGLTFGVSYLGLPDPDTVTDTSLETNISDSENYFKWALDEDGNIDTAACPVATDAALALINDTSSSSRSETLTNMRYVFLDSDSSSGVYLEVVNTVLAQEFYTERYDGWLFDSWAALAVFYLPLAFIWFFVIPLIFPDGQTLGKKLLGVAVVRSDGYALTWGRHILHPLFIFIIVASASAIPFNLLSQYISLLMFMILAVIDYMFALLGKGKNMTLTDRLSKTMVIDAKSSLWFANKEAEEEYEESHSTLRPKSAFFSEEQKAENARIALEDSILDLSTIDRHRKEAEAITSFDDFEKHGVDISDVTLDETPKGKE